LGSSFAGAKAGILAGIFFAGTVGAFNLILLETFHDRYIQLLFVYGCNGTKTAIAQQTPQQCFGDLVSYIPFLVFVIFIVSLVFASLYGRFYERVPGQGRKSKASSVGLVMLIALLLMGYAGIFLDSTARSTLIVYDIIATVIYSVILGTLYGRYTRTVEFVSPSLDAIRIQVDGRDVTGKARTFSAKSNHKLTAVAGESASFKGWSSSGGVSVEDNKSFETVMRVTGNGLVRVTYAKKS
jgi:MFS family permease